jgi:hypothetical protein
LIEVIFAFAEAGFESFVGDFEIFTKSSGLDKLISETVDFCFELLHLNSDVHAEVGQKMGHFDETGVGGRYDRIGGISGPRVGGGAICCRDPRGSPNRVWWGSRFRHSSSTGRVALKALEEFVRGVGCSYWGIAAALNTDHWNLKSTVIRDHGAQHFHTRNW